MHMLAKDSEVRGKPLQLGKTYHRRRTFRKTKTAGKATGNHPGKYVMRETNYAAAQFCGVDMPSRPLNWCINSRHVKKCHKPAFNSEDQREMSIFKLKLSKVRLTQGGKTVLL